MTDLSLVSDFNFKLMSQKILSLFFKTFLHTHFIAGSTDLFIFLYLNLSRSTVYTLNHLLKLSGAFIFRSAY